MLSLSYAVKEGVYNGRGANNGNGANLPTSVLISQSFKLYYDFYRTVTSMTTTITIITIAIVYH